MRYVFFRFLERSTESSLSYLRTEIRLTGAVVLSLPSWCFYRDGGCSSLSPLLRQPPSWYLRVTILKPTAVTKAEILNTASEKEGVGLEDHHHCRVKPWFRRGMPLIKIAYRLFGDTAWTSDALSSPPLYKHPGPWSWSLDSLPKDSLVADTAWVLWFVPRPPICIPEEKRMDRFDASRIAKRVFIRAARTPKLGIEPTGIPALLSPCSFLAIVSCRLYRWDFSPIRYTLNAKMIGGSYKGYESRHSRTDRISSRY